MLNAATLQKVAVGEMTEEAMRLTDDLAALIIAAAKPYEMGSTEMSVALKSITLRVGLITVLSGEIKSAARVAAGVMGRVEKPPPN